MKSFTRKGGTHFSYAYNGAAPYGEILQYMIKVNNSSRTSAQNTLLTNFMNFLTGVGTSAGTNIIVSYCYSLTP